MSKSSSALIRFAGDCIELELSPVEGQPGHTIKFPLNRCGIECDSWSQPLVSQRGWNALLSILKARYSDEHRHSIGRKSAPVQYDLEAMLKSVSIQKVGRKSKAKPELTLEDLDL